jgi:hypothetical protein
MIDLDSEELTRAVLAEFNEPRKFVRNSQSRLTMSSTEVVAASGCTYRQLDYWATKGAIPTDGDMLGHGSGSRRRWPVWYVPRLALLARIQREVGAPAGNGGFDSGTLRRIFDSYESGRLDFDAFSLTWEVQ